MPTGGRFMAGLLLYPEASTAHATRAIGIWRADHRSAATGTISASGTSVTGTGTSFNSELRVGDYIIPGLAGTGTISSSGTTVTGSGTSFNTQLAVGDEIVVSGQTRIVTAIASNTSLTTDSAFSPALSGASFVFYSLINHGRVATVISSDTALTINSAFSTTVTNRNFERINLVGWDTGIMCEGFANTGLYLNSGIPFRNGAAAKKVAIRFGKDLTNLIRVRRSGTETWGLKATADYLAWESSPDSSPKTALAIDTSGNVGIGTTAPTLPFEVVPGAGSSFSVAHEGGRPVVRITDSSTENPVLQFGRSGGGSDFINLEYTGTALEASKNVRITGSNGLILPQLSSAPTAVDGMIAYADGSGWNPGAQGKGMYYYNAAISTWVKLG